MVLPRRNLSVHAYCRLRRLARRIGPIRFGQTSAGLLVAAALILLWGLERPAVAVPLAATGSNENEFFVLEWNYDLDGGVGSLIVTPKTIVPSPGSDPAPVRLWGMEFLTRGAMLMTEPSGARNYLGRGGRMVDGTPIFTHRLLDRETWEGIGLSGIATFGFRFFGTAVASSAMGVPLPVRLATTQMVCQPYTYDSRDGSYTWYPESSLEFVTVEAVPEPATIALAGLGAAAVGAVAGRRRGADDEEKPVA